MDAKYRLSFEMHSKVTLELLPYIFCDKVHKIFKIVSVSPIFLY